MGEWSCGSWLHEARRSPGRGRRRGCGRIWESAEADPIKVGFGEVAREVLGSWHDFTPCRDNLVEQMVLEGTLCDAREGNADFFRASSCGVAMTRVSWS